MLSERIKHLEIDIATAPAGQLARESQYVFTYARDDLQQPAVSLLMPPTRVTYLQGDLFPSMDMNLPEGFLFQQILERYPKQALTKMHLLALMGGSGIGRVGFRLAAMHSVRPSVIERKSLLASKAGPRLFADLLDAYLSQSAGVSGVQPKLLVPSKAAIPIPDLIVKFAGVDYPGLSANEFLCLDVARRAGIPVSGFDLSADGSLLVIDRFDLDPDGRRIGFEDIAALMGRQVHDRLSNRKYEGSYQQVAEAIALFSCRPADDLQRFFAQLALSVMVRNGDAHLKNFGLRYTAPENARLAPLFDVATTTIYRYRRADGTDAVDRTLALKLRTGRHATRTYPVTAELLDFGRAVCGVRKPAPVLEGIAQAMSESLKSAAKDERIDRSMLRSIKAEWADGQQLAAQAGRGSAR